MVAQETAQTAQVTSTVLADVHFQDAGAARGLAAAILEQYQAERRGDQQVPVFFLVGANSSTGDALGPFVGWFLKRKGFTGIYKGDLNDPVHATNLKEKLSEVWYQAMRLGKQPYIIAVDAAVGRAGRVTVNRGPLKPGAGMGKSLPAVGNVHVMGGTASFPFGIWFAGLDQTVGMAEVIADGILLFWHELQQHAPTRWGA